MNELKIPISESYYTPTQKQIIDFYNATYLGEVDALNKMLDHGFPINTMLENEENYNYGNAAIYSLEDSMGLVSFNAVDLLLERGIDINYRDGLDKSLLIYLVQFLVSEDFSEEIEVLQLKSKFEIEEVIRVKQTFDKLMKMQPSLSVDGLNGVENIFEYAMSGQVLRWFAEHAENMAEEDKLLFEEYRLAALFEED